MVRKGEGDSDERRGLSVIGRCISVDEWLKTRRKMGEDGPSDGWKVGLEDEFAKGDKK